MIFGFEDQDAAKDWRPESVLGDLEGKEVRIRLKWGRNELSERLQIDEEGLSERIKIDEEGPRTAMPSTGASSIPEIIGTGIKGLLGGLGK